LMIGDFNLIFREEDKNNNRLNRNLMLQFRRAINHLEVKEIQLKGRKFTWSNGQQAPTMTNIDRAFCSPQLEDCFQNPVLQALSSPISDHCPLLLTPFPTQWLDQNSDLKGTGLICLDSMIVSRVDSTHNAFTTLHIKLSRTAKTLNSWAKTIKSQSKMAMEICREVIE
jgi:hypothetical protein